MVPVSETPSFTGKILPYLFRRQKVGIHVLGTTTNSRTTDVVFLCRGTRVEPSRTPM